MTEENVKVLRNYTGRNRRLQGKVSWWRQETHAPVFQNKLKATLGNEIKFYLYSNGNKKFVDFVKIRKYIRHGIIEIKLFL